MHPLLTLILLAGFALALMVAGAVEAEESEWNYTTGNDVLSVAISVDGEYIAAGSRDDWVYFFDKDSNTPLWNYVTGGDVRSVAISSDGEYIAAGSFDDNIYLFQKDSSTPLWSYNTGQNVPSVAISADGEYIAAGSFDSRVYLFHKDSSTPLWSHNAGDWVWSVAISADGEYIAAGSHRNITLFHKDSATPLWHYNAGSEVNSIAITTDGKYIAASSADDRIHLFDKDSATPLWNYTTGGEVYSVSISADGEYIAAGFGPEVYLFDKESSTPLWSYTTAGNVNSVSISADGGHIVAGNYGNEVYLFENGHNEPLWSYTAGSTVNSVSISADGEDIAAGSRDDKVYYFDKNIPPMATIDSIMPSPASNSVQVNFSGSGVDSDGDVIAYQWASSIDGELSSSSNFNTSSLNVGNHTISFRVQDNSGVWSDWDTVFLVIINVPPTASIDSISPSPARFDEEVTLIGSGIDSDGSVVTFQWVSDVDGSLSTEESFSTTNFTTGIHQISFRVQDNNGAWSSWHTVELHVYPNTPPSNTIDSIEPSAAEAGTTVFFDGTGSDSDGAVVAYLWASSIDGELSTEEDFSSNSLSLGHHVITFRVQDNDGAVFNRTWSNPPHVSLWIYALPTAIAGDNFTGEPGDTFQFDGLGTDNDGSIIKYEWDFEGDGVYRWSSTNDGNTTYVYNSKGTYTVTLRVTDEDGFTATDSLVVTVSKAGGDNGDGDDGGGGIPAPSLAASIAAVAVIALRRRS